MACFSIVRCASASVRRSCSISRHLARSTSRIDVYKRQVYDGYVTVEQNDLYGLYDLAGGKLAVPCEYDEIYSFGLATIYRYVHNGFVCVEKDGKGGFVDTDGQVTCELKYGAAGVTQHGLSLIHI